jgi:predicted CoA-binding protein
MNERDVLTRAREILLKALSQRRSRLATALARRLEEHSYSVEGRRKVAREKRLQAPTRG